jgi:xanthine dehydrogenase molybdopterin-binding subunit B
VGPLVDRETGKVQVIHYTAVQDAGRAIHPSLVEGQIQGGVAQGIGWALNEECIFGTDGGLDNPSFLDYRMPVASDLPMIEAVVIEVPNDKHPQGVRGVAEVPIVPAPVAVANAVRNAIGLRLTDLPMARGLDSCNVGGDRSAGCTRGLPMPVGARRSLIVLAHQESWRVSRGSAEAEGRKRCER